MPEPTVIEGWAQIQEGKVILETFGKSKIHAALNLANYNEFMEPNIKSVRVTMEVIEDD